MVTGTLVPGRGREGQGEQGHGRVEERDLLFWQQLRLTPNSTGHVATASQWHFVASVLLAEMPTAYIL